MLSSVIKISVVPNKEKDINVDSQKHGFVHNPVRHTIREQHHIAMSKIAVRGPLLISPSCYLFPSMPDKGHCIL